MDESVAQLEKRIALLEAKVATLEGKKQKLSTADFVPEIKSEVKGNNLPVWAIIGGILALILLLNSVPSLLSSIFGIGFGYSRFSSTSLIFALIGLGLLYVSARPIFVKHGKAESKPETVISKEDFAAKPVGLELKETGETGSGNFEFNIAANWFAIVGIIAIVFAVVFFLKFAFDNGLIGPVGQVSIGIFFGIILIFAGELLRAKVAKYSQVISGGGVVVLYLSIWAANGLFNLISSPTTLLGLSFITILSTSLAIRYEAVHIAVLGVVGGFTAPILLGKGFDNQVIVMSYVVILNLGVLAVAFFKNWKELSIATFAGTYIVILSWLGQYYKEEKFLLTFSFLTLIFLIFAVSLFVYNFVYRKESEESDIIIMLLNGFAYFGVGYFLITQVAYKDLIGFFAFALSVFYFLLGYLSFQKFKESSYLTLGLLGISIFFLTLAVPLQVKQNLITIIWAVEGASLMLLAFLIKSFKLRAASLTIYLLVFARLFAFDTKVVLESFNLVFNLRFLTFLIAAAAVGASSFMYSRFKNDLREEEEPVLPAFIIVLSIILIWAFSWEAISFFNKKIEQVKKTEIQISMRDVRVLSYRVSQGIQINEDNSFRNVQPAGGVQLKINELNQAGTNPFSKYISGATVKITDTTGTRSIVQGFSQAGGMIKFENLPAGRYGIMAYKAGYKGVWKQNGLGLGSGCEDTGGSGSTSEVIIKNNNTEGLEAAWDGNLTIISGQTVLCRDLGLTPVTNQYQERPNNNFQSPRTPNYNNPNRYNPAPNNYEPPRQLGAAALEKIKGLESERDVVLSVIWLLYAITLLAVGIISKYKPVRLFALGFLVLTILKVFLFDSRNLQQGYRIVAFMVLGIILLGISLVYQKYKTQISAFLLK